jgi:hypothetical protein
LVQLSVKVSIQYSKQGRSVDNINFVFFNRVKETYLFGKGEPVFVGASAEKMKRENLI